MEKTKFFYVQQKSNVLKGHHCKCSLFQRAGEVTGTASFCFSCGTAAPFLGGGLTDYTAPHLGAGDR